MMSPLKRDQFFKGKAGNVPTKIKFSGDNDILGDIREFLGEHQNQDCYWVGRIFKL